MDIEIDVPMPATDPLQVPAAGTWYVHLPTGKQLGPVGSSTVQEWLDQARIGVDTLVWREGWAEWRTVRDSIFDHQIADSGDRGCRCERR